jgi:hypothetical protein
VSASADHIKALVESHSSGDDEGFYAVTLQVAAKAARQGHHRLASELKQLVDAARNKDKGGVDSAISQTRGDLAELVVATFPKTRLRDLVLVDDLRSRLELVVAEQRQRHRLIEQGFNPAHRLLLEGPPGTGKTMTAAALDKMDGQKDGQRDQTLMLHCAGSLGPDAETNLCHRPISPDWLTSAAECSVAAPREVILVTGE